jgi:alpha-tubulin suppressor-like RCC1 family protein
MPASVSPWSRLSAWAGWVVALVLFVLAPGCPSAGPPSSGGGTTPPGGGNGRNPAEADGPVVEVAAGAGHVCARRSSGRVSCWGRNDFGQLGDGTTTDRTQPVPVLNLQDAVALAVGDDHSCALLGSGQPICWGRNDLGQLGNGEGSPSKPRAPRPVSVRNLVDATALASGSHHVCALRKAGSPVCWGDNRRRQLGNEGRASWVAPVAVEGLGSVVQLAAGEGHTCARRNQGNVLCWGDARHGQLGDGGDASSAAPRAAAGTEGAVHLAAGKSHACITRPSGEVACWGANGAGQVDGKPGEAVRRPAKVAIGGITHVAAGEAHTCGRAGDGSVRCWGTNQQGRLGDGTTLPRTGVVAVAGLSDAEQLALGRSHACVVRRGGKVACWGRNEGGALGAGAPGPAAQGGALFALDVRDATAIATGLGFACAHTATGKVVCWGANDKGQLGNGAHGDARRPVEVSELRDVTSLAVGWAHACATTQQGAVLCWGDDAKGQLGAGASKASHRRKPVAVPSLRDAVEVAAGREHTCARRKTGEVTCWGDNAFGQTGAPAGDPQRSPVVVAGLRDARQLAAGGGHSCAVRNGGGVTCWGSNLFGQLGNGASATTLKTPQPQPVAVAKLADAAEVRLGEQSSCARRQTGQVACWGRNDAGQLGGGTESDWSTRIPVKDLTAAIALGLGPRQACAATSAGLVQCWGSDDGGHLSGTPGRTLRVPAPPVPGLGGIVQVDTAPTHACARLSDGRVACWGDNDRGQLGDGGIDHESRPVAVTGL